MAARYNPGPWVGMVRSETAVLLAPGTPPALVLTVWDLLGEAPEVHEVLHAVTTGFGGSLTDMPSFGIVGFKDPLRVFLRGDLDLEIDSPDGGEGSGGDRGPLTLNGRNVSTWAERWIGEPGNFRLTVSGAVTGAASWPLGEGVVQLGSLDVTVGGSRAAVPRAVVEVPAAVSDVPATEASTETMMAPVDEDLEYTAGPVVAEAVPELTGNYDHLWEKTVARSIEDAAVRDDSEHGGLEGQDGQEPGNAGPGQPRAAAYGDAEADAAEPGTDEPAAAIGSAGAQASPNPPVPPAPAPVAGSGLIDSVPWRTAGVPAAPVPAPAPESFAAEVNRQPSFPEPSFDPDHDGMTIMKSALAGADAQPAPAAAAPNSGPMVLARVCADGHANPPTNAECAACGRQLPSDARQVPRPQLGVMRISTGEVVQLDQSLVIGRQPSVSRVPGGGMPRLVQVASPGGDISRSHVEVRLEGWHVMLCDLKATNGTVLVRQGQPPRRLAQNEMAILLDGDIAELGDDISLRFEEIR